MRRATWLVADAGVVSEVSLAETGGDLEVSPRRFLGRWTLTAASTGPGRVAAWVLAPPFDVPWLGGLA